MHAYIVSGGTYHERTLKIADYVKSFGVSPFDCVRINTPETSVGIEEIREFQKRLILKPLNSPYTIGIIEYGEMLTEQAQQALLKTLEEPPPHVLLYISVPVPDLLLPTIRSRCQTISIPSEALLTNETAIGIHDAIKTLQSPSWKIRAASVEAIAGSRENALRWVDQALTVSEKNLLTGQKKRKTAHLLRLLLLAKKELQSNCTPSLVLDVFGIRASHL